MAKPNCSSGVLPLKAKKLTISLLVISLPFLYVSLLRIPPYSLVSDTIFWFLMSNSIIIIVAADSGMFSSDSTDLHDEYVKFSRGRSAAAALLVMKPSLDIASSEGQEDVAAAETSVANREEDEEVDEKSIVLYEKPKRELSNEKRLVLHQSSLPLLEPDADEKTRLRRSATEKGIDCRVEEKESEYSNLSYEELNRRVEEFIRRFNREIRLQLRDECCFDFQELSCHRSSRKSAVFYVLLCSISTEETESFSLVTDYKSIAFLFNCFDRKAK